MTLVEIFGLELDLLLSYLIWVAPDYWVIAIFVSPPILCAYALRLQRRKLLGFLIGMVFGPIGIVGIIIYRMNRIEREAAERYAALNRGGG